MKIAGRTIAEMTALTVADAHAFFARSRSRARRPRSRREVLKEIRSRLRFLLDVGPRLPDARPRGPSLSGGEGQRIRLASQIGSELTGVLYVLDEPSIGLHQRDNRGCSQRSSTCATSATPWSSSSTTRRRSRPPTG